MLDDVETLVPPIDARLRKTMIDELGVDWMAQWEQGIPEWEQVPGHINIWEILRLWNHAKALDMVEFGKMRYNLLGNADHWFPGLNATRLGEHDLSQCLANSPFRDRIVSILTEAHAMLLGEEKKRLSST
jgi:uncharacterized protein